MDDTPGIKKEEEEEEAKPRDYIVRVEKNWWVGKQAG